MSTNATAQFWLRPADGSDLNGGGYDAGISGAGTNYSDQAAPQASWANLTLASGTITDAGSTGLFTTAMIGNLINVASQGYYWITARTSANAVTVVAATNTTATAFTGASGKVGGAWASFVPMATASPTSPGVAGNQFNLRGAGLDEPTGPDITLTAFYVLPAGDEVTGKFRVVAYNGRFMISTNQPLVFNTAEHQHFEGIAFKATAAAFSGAFGFIHGQTYTSATNCTFDQNGVDMHATESVGAFLKCQCKNSGVTTLGTYAAISEGGVGMSFADCEIIGWRGDGLSLIGQGMKVSNSIIGGCTGNGVSATVTQGQGNAITGCTIDNNGGHGVYLNDATSVAKVWMRDNLITNHTVAGKAGIYANGLTAAQSARLAIIGSDYNAYWNNTANRTNFPAGPNDLDLGSTPYVDSAPLTNRAWGVNTLVKGNGSTGAFRGTSTTSYLDRGAVQRQEPSGGTVPATTDVRAGVAVGSGTGTLIVPPANKVLTTATYDASTVGTVALPTAAQVQAAVPFGPGSGLTGTYDPVTGRFSNPGSGNVALGTSYLFAGTTINGTYDPVTGQYTDPTGTRVAVGTSYLFAGSTINGSFAGTDPWATVLPGSYAQGTAGWLLGGSGNFDGVCTGGGSTTLGLQAGTGDVAKQRVVMMSGACAGQERIILTQSGGGGLTANIHRAWTGGPPASGDKYSFNSLAELGDTALNFITTGALASQTVIAGNLQGVLLDSGTVASSPAPTAATFSSSSVTLTATVSGAYVGSVLIFQATSGLGRVHRLVSGHTVTGGVHAFTLTTTQGTVPAVGPAANDTFTLA